MLVGRFLVELFSDERVDDERAHSLEELRRRLLPHRLPAVNPHNRFGLRAGGLNREFVDSMFAWWKVGTFLSRLDEEELTPWSCAARCEGDGDCRRSGSHALSLRMGGSLDGSRFAPRSSSVSPNVRLGRIGWTFPFFAFSCASLLRVPTFDKLSQVRHPANYRARYFTCGVPAAGNDGERRLSWSPGARNSFDMS